MWGVVEIITLQRPLQAPACWFMVCGWRIQVQPLTHGVQLEASLPLPPPSGQRCAHSRRLGAAPVEVDPPPETFV